MLTDKDYCDYETCVALRELGFNALVDWYFNEDKRIVSSLATYRDTYIPRISLYEAQKWFREEKEIAVFVTYDKNTSKWFATVINMDSLETINMAKCNLYEEAFFEGIQDAVEILKEK